MLHWLLDETGGACGPGGVPASGFSNESTSAEELRALWEVDDVGPGRPMVAFVEQLLHETGILKALGRPSWMP